MAALTREDFITDLATFLAIFTLLDVELAATFGRATKKMIMDFDKDGYFDELLKAIEEQPDSLIDRCRYQLEILGDCNIVDKTINPHIYFILEMSPKKKYGYLTLYQPYSGKRFTVKYWNTTIDRNPIQAGDHVYITAFDEKYKRYWNGELNANGKQVWVDDTSQTELWLKGYRKC